MSRLIFKRFALVMTALILVGVALVAYARLTSKAIDGIACNFTEQSRYHVHAHLTILLHGHSRASVPAQIGIDNAHLCLYWLHTHDATGIIHIEAPSHIHPTLGQFFDIWGQPLTPRNVAGRHAGGSGIRVFVNGHRYAGPPRSVPLRAYTDVVIEVGAPFIPPPRANFAGY